MFSSAVSIGSRLKNWKMNPMCSRRSFVSSVSLSPAELGAGDQHLARRSAGRAPARMCMSVDLPEPDGPMIAVSSPGTIVERDAAQRIDGRVALAVAARDLVRGDREAIVA